MHDGFVLLNCDLGSEEYIVEELRQMPNVKNAYLTFGAYDVIAEINTEDQKAFDKAVAGIRKLSRVVSTMTLSVINSE
ncbi:MAG: Lrp/AsnC family transcriptional regulator [Nitrosarchaeum sp.]|jgi:DNA-binding Lrp family transcriptional regulator|nr:Lrp/AsnC family transcriptional regulator [Nitrosarchaeum sp.]